MKLVAGLVPLTCAIAGLVACGSGEATHSPEEFGTASAAYSGIECISNSAGQWQVAAYRPGSGAAPSTFGVCYWDGTKNVFVQKSESPKGSYVTATGVNCADQAGTLWLFSAFDSVNKCP